MRIQFSTGHKILKAILHTIFHTFLETFHTAILKLKHESYHAAHLYLIPFKLFSPNERMGSRNIEAEFK